jgi:site-specific DNA recombinase
MSEGNDTKGLRFAALVRVSTERQEKEGESLRTQRASIQRDVERLGGKVVVWYGGQEHATPGWERAELSRLLADAGKGRFDAVMVAYADRWSRDNAQSKSGLDAFRRHQIRFFVGATEYDLFRPEHSLFLGLSAEIGEFQAAQQNKKSMENRIAKAHRGLPVSGQLPWGRTWTAAGGWAVDPEKQALIALVAERYLAGESLLSLAKKYGKGNKLTLGNLHKVLTARCGDTWEQRFRSRSLNIDETVITKVPRLLPEETIEAIRRKAADNLTHRPGAPCKYDYLLSHFVRCAHCGAAFHGQPDPKGRRLYYRHLYRGFMQRDCPDAAAMVRAEDLDAAVLQELFDCFGNPAAVQQAVEAATPDRGKVEDLRRRRRAVNEQLGKARAARERVVAAIADGTITNAHAKKQMADLEARAAALEEEAAEVNAELASLPTEEEVKAAAARVAGAFGAGDADDYDHLPYGDAVLAAKKNVLNHHPECMSAEDKRALVETVFTGKASGERFGVYVQRVPGRERGWRQEWRFRLFGRLTVNQWGRTGAAPREEFLGGPDQAKLLAEAGGGVGLFARRGVSIIPFYH